MTPKLSGCQLSHSLLLLIILLHVNTEEGLKIVINDEAVGPQMYKRPLNVLHTGSTSDYIQGGEKMKAMQVISLTLLCALAASAQFLKFGKCPKPAVQANFDSTRYVGKWYEIMKLPTAFQKGECGTATYSPKSPGVIGVLNRELLDDGTINSIVGSARTKNPAEPGKLEVSFDDIPSPPGPYWVLSSDYEGHSLVYGCTDFGLFRMEFSWILSREPTLNEETVEMLHGILSSIGVNPDKMVPTVHDETYCRAMEQ